MPLYEFECPIHGVFEMYFPISRSDITEIVCDALDPAYAAVDLVDEEYRCAEIAERIVSIYSPQPDKYWAGHVVNGKYVTKKSEISKDVVPATRDNIEYVAKQKVKVRKEFEESSTKKLKEYLVEQTAGMDFGPDDKHTERKRKQMRKDDYARTGTGTDD